MRTRSPAHLSDHAVPRSVDLLPMFAVGDQVKVVGELDRLGDLLQDVDAETLTAAFDVNARLLGLVPAQTATATDKHSVSNAVNYLV